MINIQLNFNNLATGYLAENSLRWHSSTLYQSQAKFVGKCILPSNDYLFGKNEVQFQAQNPHKTVRKLLTTPAVNPIIP